MREGVGHELGRLLILLITSDLASVSGNKPMGPSHTDSQRGPVSRSTHGWFSRQRLTRSLELCEGDRWRQVGALPTRRECRAWRAWLLLPNFYETARVHSYNARGWRVWRGVSRRGVDLGIPLHSPQEWTLPVLLQVKPSEIDLPCSGAHSLWLAVIRGPGRLTATAFANGAIWH